MSHVANWLIIIYYYTHFQKQQEDGGVSKLAPIRACKFTREVLKFISALQYIILYILNRYEVYVVYWYVLVIIGKLFYSDMFPGLSVIIFRTGYIILYSPYDTVLHQTKLILQ